MRISYDKEADALYVEFREGTLQDNKKIDDLTILDCDAEGNILGIEFLDASKRIPPESLSEIRVENIVAVPQ